MPRRSHLQGFACPLKMGLMGCPETSVINYQTTLRNIPEERRSALLVLSLCDLKVNRNNSNKSPTRGNNFPVYYPDVYLQLNKFRAFSRPSSGAQLLQWQPLVLPSYRGDSRAVFMVGPVILITVTFASAERLVSVGPSSLIFISEDSVLLSYDVLSLGYWFPTFRRTSAFFLKSKVNPHQLPYPSK